MSASLHPSFAGLERIDWGDTSSILEGCTPLFNALTSDHSLLTALLEALSGDEYLGAMCERYDFLDKLVLHAAGHDDDVRLRLHLYRSGYYDRPHNHRWSFASHILRGRYVHRIFGRDDLFDENTDPDSLHAIHERIQARGATYALHHSSVHTVQADTDTISLLVRGPAAKERFLILDRAAGSSIWVYGAAQEAPEQRAAKRMTGTQLLQTIARVRELITPNATS